MNEHLSERISRGNGTHRQVQEDRNSYYGRVAVAFLPPKLNPHVSAYFKRDKLQAASAAHSWLSLPEVPTADEFLDLPTPATTSRSSLTFPVNKPVGPWSSKGTSSESQRHQLQADMCM